MSVPARTLTVSICTFRRAHLERTLASLETLDVPPGVTVDVLVADNDTEPTAADLVARLARSSRFSIRYAHAPARNISIARNACLDRADGRFLAFLDDDEVVSPSWLCELLRAADAGAAPAAVLGPVRAVYGAGAPAWMRDGDFHSTLPVFVNGRIVTGYTCNVLLDREARALEGLRFDLARGRSGGEDTAFFSALHARGGRIAYAPEAWVEEDVPPGRASLAWLARRRFRMGQTHGQLLRQGSLARRLPKLAAAGAKMGACALLALRHLRSPIERRRSLLRGVLHTGTLFGLLGMRPLTQYGGEGAPSASPRDAHAA